MELDFSGLDMLTDMAFKMMEVKPRVFGNKGKMFNNDVTVLDLSGCLHVTLIGVKWIAKSFPNLNKVTHRYFFIS